MEIVNLIIDLHICILSIQGTDEAKKKVRMKLTISALILIVIVYSETEGKLLSIV